MVIHISYACISYIYESPTMILKDSKQLSHDTYIMKCKNWYPYKISTSQAHNNSLRAQSQHICDKFGKDLANGYIVTDTTAGLNHDKRVCNGEKKVYIERVFYRKARLWDAP